MKKIFLYIAVIFSFLGVSAQENTKEVLIDSLRIEKKQFNNETINSYKSSDTFDYAVEESGPSLYEQISEWFNRVLRKIFSWFFDDVETPVGFVLTLIEILPYIIAVIVLYLIINFFLKVNSRNIINGQNNKEIVHIKDEEELLNSKDLPQLIALALKEQNYRLATRYQYVLLLQKLSNKELIVWEQQKTNEDYIKEVARKNIHTEFEEITRFYDYVWYGNFEINNQEYLNGIKSISEIEQKIK